MVASTQVQVQVQVLKPERSSHQLPLMLEASLEILELFYFHTFQVGLFSGLL